MLAFLSVWLTKHTLTDLQTISLPGSKKATEHARVFMKVNT
jgi:hypothetical protein